MLGFFGEYENPWDGTLLVVKCHRFKTENSQQYDTGIVLVRNPFKAMISEYNRILTGKNHTAVADQSQFAGPGKTYCELSAIINKRWNKFEAKNGKPRQIVPLMCLSDIL